MFLFISILYPLCGISFWIQIHLMFLFIYIDTSNSTAVTGFKYISCSYSSQRLETAFRQIFIQIHLMFLFISSIFSTTICNRSIQIHLMFLFIPSHSGISICYVQFKYISCSYSSKQCRQGASDFGNSNTSHVLIHPAKNNKIGYDQKFKYISCSYSSYCCPYSIGALCKFKYISCSYSSHVFSPFLISIIIIYPLLYKVSHTFSQVFLLTFPILYFFRKTLVYSSKILSDAHYPPGKFYKIKVSPFTLSCTPITSSPNTPSFINLIIQIKSSSS